MKVTKNAKIAVTTSPFVLEGVISGFLIMALPMALIGLVVGMGLKLVNAPLRAFYSPVSANSSGGMM